MKVALIGAELEENLGLRYMASSLEKKHHEVKIIPFNDYYDTSITVEQVLNFSPQMVGLSMVFTTRGKEFCHLSIKLRLSGYIGHIIAGGPFASFNCERLLNDFPSLDSVCLTEGEKIICKLADNLSNLSDVSNICYRNPTGQIIYTSNDDDDSDIDQLPFPKRTGFHDYFGLPIASIISSRGCWRNCAFCSINAWYNKSGNRKFRVRSISNIVEEIKQLYYKHGVRIFNFQDDNFYLPDKTKSLERFENLNYQLNKEGIKDIAIAIKARPDSITEESVAVLDKLGLFRVFLGVENASENGLKNLNRKCSIEQIINSLTNLNKYDIHVAYNLLMFEPETTMNDILINLRFMEQHIENPQNFCRAEPHAGTGLECKLKTEGKLLGDYFGLDYRIKNPQVEIFHQISNYAFMDRNFNNNGLHYFNMQVDFYYQLLRRFFPEVLNQTLRSYVKNFIKRTNLDTYNLLSRIYDFVVSVDNPSSEDGQKFAFEMRYLVDNNSRKLRKQGEHIIAMLDSAFKRKDICYKESDSQSFKVPEVLEIDSEIADPYENKNILSGTGYSLDQILNLGSKPIPYHKFKHMIK
jgi:radical SAM superfamily enzyme YgiQ (UPF0313 family)